MSIHHQYIHKMINWNQWTLFYLLFTLLVLLAWFHTFDDLWLIELHCLKSSLWIKRGKYVVALSKTSKYWSSRFYALWCPLKSSREDANGYIFWSFSVFGQHYRELYVILGVTLKEVTPRFHMRCLRFWLIMFFMIILCFFWRWYYDF